MYLPSARAISAEGPVFRVRALCMPNRVAATSIGSQDSARHRVIVRSLADDFAFLSNNSCVVLINLIDFVCGFFSFFFSSSLPATSSFVFCYVIFAIFLFSCLGVDLLCTALVDSKFGSAIPAWHRLEPSMRARIATTSLALHRFFGLFFFPTLSVCVLLGCFTIFFSYLIKETFY